MPTPILMPALSPTMEEGKLAKWLVQEGSRIKPGDILVKVGDVDVKTGPDTTLMGTVRLTNYGVEAPPAS